MTIWTRFCAVVDEHAGRQAIVWPGGAWTYAQLHEQSDLVARRFGAPDQTQSPPVALYLPRGAKLIAALLAAARLGRPWCILPTRAPLSVARQTLAALGPCDLFCEDSDPAATSLAGGLPVRLIPRIPAPPSPAPPAAPGSPAGICFTSGSTGEPKGVVFLQGSTVWNACAANELLEIGPDDRYLWLTAAGSAATYPALFSTLLHGACLLPFEIAERGFSDLAALIAESRATIFHAIPSLFRRFVRDLRDPSQLQSLRMVKLGGEPLFAADVRLFRERFPRHTELINGLGMAETNGILCHGRISRDEDAGTTAPVGRALPGYDLSLWDAEGRRVTAAGEPGRLQISSPWLALGYWDRHTSQAIPFPAAGGLDTARLFQSEDRCMLLDDGRLVHVGRSDGTVKVRGTRVSLAAVEALLRQVPGVAEAVVEPIQAAGQEVRVFAWIEPVPGAEIAAVDIRHRLKTIVASESIPERIHVLDRIPLLAGGKLDRKSLQALAAAESCASGAQSDPSSPAAQMAGLFARALGRTGFAPDEDFFAAGGDSLAAAELAASVEAQWNCMVHPGDLAENPTPARLIAALGTETPRPAFRLASGEACGPIFWVFGGAGDPAFYLLPLARALRRGRLLGQVYGFEAGLDDSGGCAARVEQMSEPMFRAMREIQPHGPYLLAGTSFGGWLAFDVAWRLHKAGEKVEFLGMLDAFGPGYPKFSPAATLAQRKQHYLVHMQRRYHMGLAKGAPLRRTRTILRRAATLSRLLFRPNAIPPDPLTRSWLLQEACLAARRHYRFEVYPGPITVFPAESQFPGAYEEDPSLGWGSWSALPVRSIPIAGQHGVHVIEPHVHGLARILLDEIGAASSQSPKPLRIDETPLMHSI